MALVEFDTLVICHNYVLSVRFVLAPFYLQDMFTSHMLALKGPDLKFSMKMLII